MAAFSIALLGLSAGTGKYCVFGYLGLVYIWNCFVFCLLFLLFYVISAPVSAEAAALLFFVDTMSNNMNLIFRELTSLLCHACPSPCSFLFSI